MSSSPFNSSTKIQTLLSPQNILVVFVATLPFLLLKLSRSKKISRPIPGPFSIPLLGSIFTLPKFLNVATRHQTRIDLAKTYGKIVQLNIGRLKVIFLNDVALIKEAFLTKGEFISDRQIVSDKVSQMMGRGKGLPAAKYDREFKERKMLTLHSMKDFGLGGKSLDETVQDESTFLNNHFRKVADASTPSYDHQDYIAKAVSNVISSVVFGRRFQYNDEKFNEAINAIRVFFQRRPSSTLTSRIPFIDRLPYFRKMMEKDTENVKKIVDFIDDQIAIHKSEFDASYPKDFVDLCLLKMQENEEGASKSTIGAENIKKIILDLFAAGTDTTAASLSFFLLYMIWFPGIQKKCQEEIDEVLDTHGNLANKSMGNLFPYTTATLLETQRIASIAPTSLPHMVRKDTLIGEGYLLEEGSMVLAHIEFLHMNEENWKNPQEFDPQRWIDPKDPSKVIQHPHFVPFSLGKRRCPGENLAKAEYLGFAIALLRDFNFMMVDSSQPPPLKGEGGIVFSPKPFEMLIEKRVCQSSD